MLNLLQSVLLLLYESILGILAVWTFAVANREDALPHSIAWGVEVLLFSTGFLLLLLFASTFFQVLAFIVGVVMLSLGLIIGSHQRSSKY